MRNKLKALLQWFVALEPQKHRHWCRRPTVCKYQGFAWHCNGILCVNTEYKDCQACAASRTTARKAK